MLGMMMMYLLTEGTSCHHLVAAGLCLQGVLSYTTNNDRKTTAAAHLQVVKLVRHPHCPNSSYSTYSSVPFFVLE